MRPDYPIRTARLDLRPHRESDLDDLFEFHSSPDVTRFVPWPVRSRDQTREALKIKLGQGELSEAGQWLVLAIEHRESQKVIGEVLLKWVSAEHRQGEIGFALNADYQGRGFAFEASEEILRLGFEVLGLHRIAGNVIAGNVSSGRLLRRLGMNLEGTFIESVFWKGAGKSGNLRCDPR